MQPVRNLVETRPETARGRRTVPSFDVDREEAELFAIVEGVLAGAGRTLDPAVARGACRARLRARLEAAIATGRWARRRRLVRECAHRGAHVALLIAEQDDAVLGEPVVELACRVIEANRSMIAVRLRTEDLRTRGLEEEHRHG
jgi:hypothetical protein